VILDPSSVIRLRCDTPSHTPSHTPSAVCATLPSLDLDGGWVAGWVGGCAGANIHSSEQYETVSACGCGLGASPRQWTAACGSASRPFLLSGEGATLLRL
jgi:hypothetical protein